MLLIEPHRHLWATRRGSTGPPYDDTLRLGQALPEVEPNPAGQVSARRSPRLQVGRQVEPALAHGVGRAGSGSVRGTSVERSSVSVVILQPHRTAFRSSRSAPPLARHPTSGRPTTTALDDGHIALCRPRIHPSFALGRTGARLPGSSSLGPKTCDGARPDRDRTLRRQALAGTQAGHRPGRG